MDLQDDECGMKYKYLLCAYINSIQVLCSLRFSKIKIVAEP